MSTPTSGLLCRTDRLPEEKARRRAKRHRQAQPVERISLAADRELRLIEGIWYEVRLAILPEPVYRTVRETLKVPRKRSSSKGGVIELGLDVRRLITPQVRDIVTNQPVPVGPEIDDTNSWNAYRGTHPDRRYGTRQAYPLAAELRRHGLTNRLPEEG